MDKNRLLNNIEKVKSLASTSKVRRMLRHPFKYCYAILFRELIYKRQKKAKEVIGETFFESKMNILLPSSTDIYLTGGKSHFSEIKLAKFLIRNLKIRDVFFDIGAHYGYFSLLASKLVGNSGRVIAFEAAPSTFKILKKNKVRENNLDIFNTVLSDTRELLKFYQFPNLYSEYSTLNVKQFSESNWYNIHKPKEIIVESDYLDNFIGNTKIYPTIIKIDVEGAEYKVLKGAIDLLKEQAPIIVMEYLSDKRGNTEHIKAEHLLNSLGYLSFRINMDGDKEKCNNIRKFLRENKVESDNIVFVKTRM